jgi:hypothetical protein
VFTLSSLFFSWQQKSFFFFVFMNNILNISNPIYITCISFLQMATATHIAVVRAHIETQKYFFLTKKKKKN